MSETLKTYIREASPLYTSQYHRKIDLIIKEPLEENLLNNKVLQLRIMNMINKYKAQLYFLEQLTELRKIEQVTQKKKETVCQEEKELIHQKNFLVPNPNDSYNRKKFKNIAGMTIGDIAKAYDVKINDILELVKTKNLYTNSCPFTSKLEIRDLFINRSYFKGIISNYLSFEAQCKIQDNSFKGSSLDLVVREV